MCKNYLKKTNGMKRKMVFCIIEKSIYLSSFHIWHLFKCLSITLLISSRPSSSSLLLALCSCFLLLSSSRVYICQFHLLSDFNKNLLKVAFYPKLFVRNLLQPSLLLLHKLYWTWQWWKFKLCLISVFPLLWDKRPDLETHV